MNKSFSELYDLAIDKETVKGTEYYLKMGFSTVAEGRSAEGTEVNSKIKKAGLRARRDRDTSYLTTLITRGIKSEIATPEKRDAYHLYLDLTLNDKGEENHIFYCLRTLNEMKKNTGTGGFNVDPVLLNQDIAQAIQCLEKIETLPTDIYSIIFTAQKNVMDNNRKIKIINKQLLQIKKDIDSYEHNAEKNTLFQQIAQIRNDTGVEKDKKKEEIDKLELKINAIEQQIKTEKKKEIETQKLEQQRDELNEQNVKQLDLLKQNDKAFLLQLNSVKYLQELKWFLNDSNVKYSIDAVKLNEIDGLLAKFQDDIGKVRDAKAMLMAEKLKDNSAIKPGCKRYPDSNTTYVIYDENLEKYHKKKDQEAYVALCSHKLQTWNTISSALTRATQQKAEIIFETMKGTSSDCHVRYYAYYPNNFHPDGYHFYQDSQTNQQVAYFSKYEVSFSLSDEALLPSQILGENAQEKEHKLTKAKSYADIIKDQELRDYDACDQSEYVTVVELLLKNEEELKYAFKALQEIDDPKMYFTYYKIASILGSFAEKSAIMAEIFADIFHTTDGQEAWYRDVSIQLKEKFPLLSQKGAWRNALRGFQQDLNKYQLELGAKLIDVIQNELTFKFQSIPSYKYEESDNFSLTLSRVDYDNLKQVLLTKNVKCECEEKICKISLPQASLAALIQVRSQKTNTTFFFQGFGQDQKDMNFSDNMSNLNAHELCNPKDARQHVLKYFGETKTLMHMPESGFIQRQKNVKVFYDQRELNEQQLNQTLSRNTGYQIKHEERYRTKYRHVAGEVTLFFNGRGEPIVNLQGQQSPMSMGMVATCGANFRKQRGKVENPKDREKYLDDKGNLKQQEFSADMQRVWAGNLLAVNSFGEPNTNTETILRQEKPLAKPLVYVAPMLALGAYINVEEFGKTSPGSPPLTVGQIQKRKAIAGLMIDAMIASLVQQQADLPYLKHIVLSVPDERKGKSSLFWQTVEQKVHQFNKDHEREIGVTLPYLHITKADIIETAVKAKEGGFYPVILNPSSDHVLGGGYTNVDVQALEEQLYGLSDAAEVADGQFNEDILDRNHHIQMQYDDHQKKYKCVSPAKAVGVEDTVTMNVLSYQNMGQKINFLLSLYEDVFTEGDMTTHTQLLTYTRAISSNYQQFQLKCNYFLQNQKNYEQQAYFSYLTKKLLIRDSLANSKTDVEKKFFEDALIDETKRFNFDMVNQDEQTQSAVAREAQQYKKNQDGIDKAIDDMAIKIIPMKNSKGRDLQKEWNDLINKKNTVAEGSSQTNSGDGDGRYEPLNVTADAADHTGKRRVDEDEPFTVLTSSIPTSVPQQNVVPPVQPTVNVPQNQGGDQQSMQATPSSAATTKPQSAGASPVFSGFEQFGEEENAWLCGPVASSTASAVSQQQNRVPPTPTPQNQGGDQQSMQATPSSAATTKPQSAGASPVFSGFEQFGEEENAWLCGPVASSTASAVSQQQNRVPPTPTPQNQGGDQQSMQATPPSAAANAKPKHGIWYNIAYYTGLVFVGRFISWPFRVLARHLNKPANPTSSPQQTQSPTNQAIGSMGGVAGSDAESFSSAPSESSDRRQNTTQAQLNCGQLQTDRPQERNGSSSSPSGGVGFQ